MSNESDSENEIFEDATEDSNFDNISPKPETMNDELKEEMKILLNQDGDLGSNYVDDIIEKTKTEKVSSESKTKQRTSEEKMEELYKDMNLSGFKDNVVKDAYSCKESTESNENVMGETQGQDKSDEEIEFDLEKQKETEALLSEEEKEELRKEAQELKAEGNELFKNAEYEKSSERYTQAIATCPLCFAKERSIMYSNRGACKLREKNYESCVKDCTKALEINPNYMKALLRRADSYEKLEKLEEALQDYQEALKMDPTLLIAREACMRLPEEIKVKNEKLKEEMMGKLKDLGNMILKPFGLSTNNFQMNQDPNTGSYSVNFQQNAEKPPNS